MVRHVLNVMMLRRLALADGAGVARLDTRVSSELLCSCPMTPPRRVRSTLPSLRREGGGLASGVPPSHRKIPIPQKESNFETNAQLLCDVHRCRSMQALFQKLEPPLVYETNEPPISQTAVLSLSNNDWLAGSGGDPTTLYTMVGGKPSSPDRPLA